MNELRKYWWIARTSFRSSWAYVGDTACRVLFLTVILYIFLRLWRTTFSETNSLSLGGLTLTQMLWYLTITEAILLSGPKVSMLVDEDVRTGAFCAQLVRPISYAGYRLATTFGERLARFVLNLATGSLISFVLVGPLANAWEGVLTLAVTLPLAFLLDFFGTFLVGLGAFWLEDTNGLLVLYSRGVLIAGGGLIPLTLYPPAIQPFLSWLPFASMAAAPAHLFVSPGVSSLVTLVAKQVVEAIVMGAIVFAVYRTAMKRVFVNGG